MAEADTEQAFGLRGGRAGGAERNQRELFWKLTVTSSSVSGFRMAARNAEQPETADGLLGDVTNRTGATIVGLT